MIIRKVRWRGRKSVLCARAGAALAVLAGAALPGAAGAATSAATVKAANGTAAVTVGAAPLGVDVGPWDALYSNPAKLSTMQSYLKAAGIDQLHYGGGGIADQYDWENNTAVNNANAACGPAPTIAAFSTACATTEPFDFTHFSANARGVGAQSFVTVNYGTGTPAMAAEWVTEADTTPGQSCRPVEHRQRGLRVLGIRRLAHRGACGRSGLPRRAIARPARGHRRSEGMTDDGGLLRRECTAVHGGDDGRGQAAGDSIKIGVPWAFDGTVGGAGVTDNTAGTTPSSSRMGSTSASWRRTGTRSASAAMWARTGIRRLRR